MSFWVLLSSGHHNCVFCALRLVCTDFLLLDSPLSWLLCNLSCFLFLFFFYSFSFFIDSLCLSLLSLTLLWCRAYSFSRLYFPRKFGKARFKNFFPTENKIGNLYFEGKWVYYGNTSYHFFCNQKFDAYIPNTFKNVMRIHYEFFFFFKIIFSSK